MKLVLFIALFGTQVTLMASTKLNSLILSKTLMNKTELSESDLKFIGDGIRFNEDKVILNQIIKKRRFFDNSAWRVDLAYNTLFLIYQDKVIVRVSFNDSMKKASINGQYFQIKQNQSISRQIKGLFEHKKTISSWYKVLIENADAKEKSLLDIKKFLIYSLLKYYNGQENVDNFFKSNEKYKSENDIKVELTKLNNVEMESNAPIVCSGNKVSGSLKSTISGMDFPMEFTSNFDLTSGKEKFKIDLKLPAIDSKVDYVFNTKPFENLNVISCEAQTFSEELKNALRKQNMAFLNKFYALNKPKSEKEDMVRLVEHLELALFNIEGHQVVEQFNPCFVYKNKKWNDPKNVMNLEDYLECFDKICNKKMNSILMDQESPPIQIHVSAKKASQNPEFQNLSQASKEMLATHKSFMDVLSKHKNIFSEKDYKDCEMRSNRCYIYFTSKIEENAPGLKDLYNDFKSALTKYTTASTPIAMAVESAKRLINSASACCMDEHCSAEFNMKKAAKFASPGNQSGTN